MSPIFIKKNTAVGVTKLFSGRVRKFYDAI